MGEQVSRRSFIRLGTVLGVGAATASLAACGGSSGEGEPGTGGYGGGGSGNGGQARGAATGGQAIARVPEVSPGSAVEFTDSGQPAVLVHLDDGSFAAYSAVCTHLGCTVAYGDGQLACPCHGSIYDPANGAEVIAGPAPQPLPEIQVEVQDGQVFRA